MLGMVALLPLLDTVDNLVTFAQKRDVFICDFIAAVKICQASLHTMYVDPATSFSTDEFWAFQNLLDCSHEQIHLKWITDLNDDSAVLAFLCHGEKIHAEDKQLPVDRTVWANLLGRVKEECTGESFTFCLVLHLPHLLACFLCKFA